jgi:glycerol-3-phosphate O-acyltransferase
MTLRAYLREPVRPVVFVPVYFGYERLFEGRSYVAELSGRPKEKETLLGISSRCGSCAASSAACTSISASPSYLDQCSTRSIVRLARGAAGEDDKPGWLGPVVDARRRDPEAINAAAAVSPVNLLAMALLATPRQSMVEQPLVRMLELFAPCCARRRTARA